MSNDWQTLLDETPLQFVELSNGEKLAYRDFRPDAPRGPLLALPGNASDHRSSFVHLAAHAAMKDVRIVAVDSRGFGQSSYNTRVNSHDDWASDYAELIQQLHLKRPVAIGHSTGGGTALALACNSPKLVAGVILMASLAPNGYRLPIMDDKKQWKKWVASKDEVDPAITAGMASPDDAVQRAVWSWVTPKVPPNDDPFTKMLYESALLQNNDCRVDVLWSNVSFNVTPLQTPSTAPSTALQSVECDVHVLHGEADGICPFAPMDALVKLVQFERWAPKSTWTMHVHNGGHMPMLECLDEFAQNVDKALTACTAKAAPASQ